MSGDPQNSDPSLQVGHRDVAPSLSVDTSTPQVDTRPVNLAQNSIRNSHPLWVTWFAHPFANWFWFYFGFVAALSGSNMGYPVLGPIVIVGWLTGHLVNAKQPWGEIKLLLGSSVMGYVCDGIITQAGVLKFHEPTTWYWPIPLWMLMMWPNFAATLNSSMKWLQGRYQLGAIMGAVAGPFSYYGGVKWGAVDLGVSFWLAMIVLGIEWALAMPVLLWLSAKWVPRSASSQP